MLAKLFEQVKNPTTAITALALAGFLFLSTTVVSQQNALASQQAAFNAQLAEHDRVTDEITDAIEELLKEQQYANSVSIKLLREVCYSTARTDDQRRRCVDLR